MDRYVIKHQYTCPHCNGEGRYYNDDWREAMEAWDKAAAVIPKSDPDSNVMQADEGIKAMTAYWVERGYSSNPKRWPPEEFTCNYCVDGIITEEVDILDALKQLEANVIVAMRKPLDV